MVSMRVLLWMRKPLAYWRMWRRSRQDGGGWCPNLRTLPRSACVQTVLVWLLLGSVWLLNGVVVRADVPVDRIRTKIIVAELRFVTSIVSVRVLHNSDTEKI